MDRNQKNRNGENVLLNNDDVQWYRVMEGTSATIVVDQQDSNIHFTISTINNTVTTILNITNAIQSYAGYYWVGTPYSSECNASLTVTATSM